MNIELSRIIILFVENKFFSDNLYFSNKLEASKVRTECKKGCEIVISESKKVNCFGKCCRISKKLERLT